MKVVSSGHGFTLFFDDKKDLKKVIEDLEELLNHIKENKVAKPYIYFTFDNEYDKEEKNKIVDKLISRFKKGKI